MIPGFALLRATQELSARTPLKTTPNTFAPASVTANEDATSITLRTGDVSAAFSKVGARFLAIGDAKRTDEEYEKK